MNTWRNVFKRFTAGPELGRGCKVVEAVVAKTEWIMLVALEL